METYSQARETEFIDTISKRVPVSTSMTKGGTSIITMPNDTKISDIYDENEIEYAKDMIDSIMHIESPSIEFSSNNAMIQSKWCYNNNEFIKFVEEQGYDYKRLFKRHRNASDFSESYTSLSIFLRMKYFCLKYDHEELWEVRKMNLFHRSIYMNNPFMRGTYASIEYMGKDDNGNIFCQFREPKFNNRQLTRNDMILNHSDFPKDIPHRNTYQEFKTIHHWGQRKLFLDELNFLLNYTHLNAPKGDKITYTFTLEDKDIENGYKADVVMKIRKDQPLIIYAGASTGEHIKYLSNLFPHHIFMLFDINDLAESLKHTNENKIYKIKSRLTLDMCNVIRELNHENLYFISDIRNIADNTQFLRCLNEVFYDKDMNRADCNIFLEDPNSEGVNYVVADLHLQETFYKALTPKKSLLKFRFPFSYVDEKGNPIEGMDYLDGDILLQSWAGFTSTETRLVVDQPKIVGENITVKVKSYIFEEYENQMYYFNTVVRPSYWQVNPDILNLGLGYDHSYDSASEILLLETYIKKQRFKNKPLSKERFLDIFQEMHVKMNLHCSNGDSKKFFVKEDILFNPDLVEASGINRINFNNEKLICDSYGEEIIILKNNE